MPNSSHSPVQNPCGTWESGWITGVLVAFISSGFVQKYAGLAGVLGYAAAVGALFAAASLMPRRLNEVLERRFVLIAGAFLVALSVIYLGLHHLEDSRGPGRSSDRDEGLEIAVTRMFSGENPYYPSHPEAGPLSLLPGAILLAVPFVLTGSVGLQNIFWIGMFLWICGRRCERRASLLSLTMMSIGVSPSAQYEIVSGGDMVANGAYAACFLILAYDSWTDRASPRLNKVATALLLGLGLASRANMILLLPLFVAFVWRKTNPRLAIGAMATVGAAYAVVVGSFYLIDPASFTPLKSREKIMFGPGYFAWADEIVLSLTVMVVIVLIMKSMIESQTADLRLFLARSAWITITPMIVMVFLASILQQRPDFRFMHDRFGLMYLFFAIGTAAFHGGTRCTQQERGVGQPRLP